MRRGTRRTLRDGRGGARARGRRTQRHNARALFDLVFVFTMTQLTSMLEHGLSIETLAQVVLILVVLFWMYSGYVWLTNQVPPVTTASRLLLIAGMAGFLVCALAVPHAFGTDGVAFAIGFFIVIVVHSWMFASAYGRGTLGFVPLNFVGATSILAAGLIGGAAAYALWLVPIVLTFVSSSLTQRDRGLAESGFSFRGGHLVERHGLLLLVAFGESIVAIGIGLAAVDSNPGCTWPRYSGCCSCRPCGGRISRGTTSVPSRCCRLRRPGSSSGWRSVRSSTPSL